MASFVKENRLKHRVLLNGHTALTRYPVRGVPVVLWINRAGVIVDAELGFHGPESLETKTKRLLAGGA